MFNIKTKSTFFAAAVGCMFCIRAASAASVTTVTVTGSNGGEPISATAVFTFTVGHLVIDLTNSVNNIHAAGSLLGGITFSLTGGGSGAASSFSIPTSGSLIDINGSGVIGTPTGSQLNALSAWGISLNNTTHVYDLQVSGNDPLIIGNPNGSNVYSNANSSLTNGSHDPYIEHTAEFSMNISGLTTSSDVSGVKFLFGTDNPPASFNSTGTTRVPDGNSGATVPTPLPEAAWGGIALMSALGAARLYNRRRSAI